MGFFTKAHHCFPVRGDFISRKYPCQLRQLSRCAPDFDWLSDRLRNAPDIELNRDYISFYLNRRAERLAVILEKVETYEPEIDWPPEVVCKQQLRPRYDLVAEYRKLRRRALLNHSHVWWFLIELVLYKLDV